MVCGFCLAEDLTVLGVLTCFSTHFIGTEPFEALILLTEPRAVTQEFVP